MSTSAILDSSQWPSDTMWFVTSRSAILDSGQWPSDTTWFVTSWSAILDSDQWPPYTMRFVTSSSAILDSVHNMIYNVKVSHHGVVGDHLTLGLRYNRNYWVCCDPPLLAHSAVNLCFIQICKQLRILHLATFCATWSAPGLISLQVFIADCKPIQDQEGSLYRTKLSNAMWIVYTKN